MPFIKTNFIQFIYKEKSGAVTKLKQEVRDDLSFCILNLESVSEKNKIKRKNLS